jgi:aminoglycoside phosphotransferase (APT) family kinase protein
MGVTDLAAPLAAVLSEHYRADVEVTEANLVTAGARRVNAVFDASVDGEPRRLVLTLMPAGEEILNPISVEAATIEMAERGGVRVPHVELASDDPRALGGPFMITSFVAGETVPRRVLRLVAERGHGATVVEQLGESLARLHAIPVDDAPAGMRCVEIDDPAKAALIALREKLDELPVSRPVLELGMRWLERHRPAPPARTSIVHVDARNGNIIVDEDGLAAILDWEIATAGGDPMQDLAWTSVRMWRFRNDEMEIGGMAGRDSLIAGYERAGGVYDAARFEWWKAAETLRWAMGLAAQAEAFLDGRVPNIVMAASGRRVSELEWDLLMLIRPDVETVSDTT